jgi:hypothetical protein
MGALSNRTAGNAPIQARAILLPEKHRVKSRTRARLDEGLIDHPSYRLLSP